jgi:hypothetical protein
LPLHQSVRWNLSRSAQRSGNELRIRNSNARAVLEIEVVVHFSVRHGNVDVEEMNVADRHRPAAAAYDIDGRAISVGRIGPVDVRVCNSQVLEREAGAVGREKAPGRAVTSALIAEGILDQDRAGRVGGVVVLAHVAVRSKPTS